MTEPNDKLLAAVGVILGIPALFLVSAGFNGYVLTFLWRWFVVPTFHVTQLTTGHAAGLVFVVLFLVPQRESKERWSERIIRVLLVPAFGLAFGLLLHAFVR